MLAERSRCFHDDLALIPDPQERFSWLVDEWSRRPGLPADERTDERLVRGCVSRVWLKAWIDPTTGHGRFASDGDSPLVKALAAVVCAFYDNAPTVEIRQTGPTFLDDLGISRQLTPTRRRGLQSLVATIQAAAP